MNTEYTDLELRLWLAKQIPNKIMAWEYEQNLVSSLQWVDGCTPVTSREWLHVVSLVEEKLTELQWDEYIRQIGFQVGTIHANLYRNYQAMLSASFRQKAIALSQTLNIPIRDQAIGDQ